MRSRDRQGKWQPFDALEGLRCSLKQTELERQKIEKPILFPDELEALNDKLLEAYASQDQVKVTYYKCGYLENVLGIVEKIDPINKDIKISGLKIKLNMIIKIEDCFD